MWNTPKIELSFFLSHISFVCIALHFVSLHQNRILLHEEIYENWKVNTTTAYNTYKYSIFRCFKNRGREREEKAQAERMQIDVDGIRCK